MPQYDGSNNNGLANGGAVPGMGVGNGGLQAGGIFGGHVVNNNHNAHGGAFFVRLFLTMVYVFVSARACFVVCKARDIAEITSFFTHVRFLTWRELFFRSQKKFHPIEKEFQVASRIELFYAHWKRVYM